MKKKLKYGLFIIMALVGFYLGLRFGFGLFTQFNYFTAKHDLKNGIVQIVEPGELPLNYREKQALANSYGFNYNYSGCFISQDLLTGIKYYNQEVVDHLEDKYGKGWWRKFQNQINNIDLSLREENKKNGL